MIPSVRPLLSRREPEATGLVGLRGTPALIPAPRCRMCALLMRTGATTARFYSDWRYRPGQYGRSTFRVLALSAEFDARPRTLQNRPAQFAPLMSAPVLDHTALLPQSRAFVHGALGSREKQLCHIATMPSSIQRAVNIAIKPCLFLAERWS